MCVFDDISPFNNVYQHVASICCCYFLFYLLLFAKKETEINERGVNK